MQRCNDFTLQRPPCLNCQRPLARHPRPRLLYYSTDNKTCQLPAPDAFLLSFCLSTFSADLKSKPPAPPELPARIHFNPSTPKLHPSSFPLPLLAVGLFRPQCIAVQSQHLPHLVQQLWRLTTHRATHNLLMCLGKTLKTDFLVTCPISDIKEIFPSTYIVRCHARTTI